jgi:hypothetical protein
VLFLLFRPSYLFQHPRFMLFSYGVRPKFILWHVDSLLCNGWVAITWAPYQTRSQQFNCKRNGVFSAVRGGSWWVEVDRGGSWWIMVHRGGSWWVEVDRGELRWIVVGRGGSWWVEVDRGGLRWIVVDRGGLRCGRRAVLEWSYRNGVNVEELLQMAGSCVHRISSRALLNDYILKQNLWIMGSEVLTAMTGKVTVLFLSGYFKTLRMIMSMRMRLAGNVTRMGRRGNQIGYG